MTAEEEFQAKIDALRKSFAAGLVARFAELDAALAAIRPGDPLTEQPVPIRTILEQTHKIAGSAGTFGFAEMSAIASRAEQLCDRILKNQHGRDEGALEELRGLIADIRAEATR